MRFAQAGATVAIVDIKAEKGEEVTAKINGDGGNAKLFHCDLVETENIETCIKAIDAVFGQIDALYNNAGLSTAGLSTAGTVETLDEADWDLIH